jgi:hypothetical protein
MDRCGRVTRWGRARSAVIFALGLGLALAPPARATLKYGPIELSGSVDSQTLLRVTQINEWQFIQNRNTALFRLDYDWLENGKLIDRFDVPFIKRSKLYMLYRGDYDSFWNIAPGGRQKGVTKFDDLVGGPIIGHSIGAQCSTPNCVCPATDPNCNALLPGLYARINSKGRNDLAFENTLREAYVDLALRDLPVSFRLGRQQVIWGESDQFRLMDVINPLDLTWHLQQEDFVNLRIPLWLIKTIVDIGDLGPLSNVFTEIVWNPGDFQAGAKLNFLPAPWSAPIPDPTRAGQIQVLNQTSSVLLTPQFNLQGTSLRQGRFDRNAADASDIGVRFHGVTDIPFINLQGFEFTANYLYARGRAIGADAGTPFGLKLEKIVIPASFTAGNAIPQNPNAPLSATNPAARFAGRIVLPAQVTAEYIHPYTHIFGATANYFEGNFTNTVFRLETAYQLGAPFQSAFITDRIHIQDTNGKTLENIAPLGFTKRDIWAGMLGFDRPTWIKFLNPRTTWFITGQFFWSYVNGSWSKLRGGTVSAGDTPYFSPAPSSSLGQVLKNGVGQWNNGQFAGAIERIQNSGVVDGNADNIRQWEILTTIAATSFYWGGTFVPFAAIAIDPVNRSFLSQLKFDYFLTNNLICQLQMKFFNDLGSGRTTLDPWGVGGLNARRDEVGLKVTYQF